MALSEHIDSLRAKHLRLDQAIDEEMHRPMPDQARITQLKREKLRLKEEIEKLRPQNNIAPLTAATPGTSATL